MHWGINTPIKNTTPSFSQSPIKPTNCPSFSFLGNLPYSLQAERGRGCILCAPRRSNWKKFKKNNCKFFYRKWKDGILGLQKCYLHYKLIFLTTIIKLLTTINFSIFFYFLLKFPHLTNTDTSVWNPLSWTEGVFQTHSAEKMQTGSETVVRR